MLQISVFRRSAAGLAVVAAMASSSSAFARSDFSNKAIRIIMPCLSGAVPDSVLRVVTEKVTKTLGQTVTIDNKPGGNGFIAIQATKAAAIGASR